MSVATEGAEMLLSQIRVSGHSVRMAVPVTAMELLWMRWRRVKNFARPVVRVVLEPPEEEPKTLPSCAESRMAVLLHKAKELSRIETSALRNCANLATP